MSIPQIGNKVRGPSVHGLAYMYARAGKVDGGCLNLSHCLTKCGGVS